MKKCTFLGVVLLAVGLCGKLSAQTDSTLNHRYVTTSLLIGAGPTNLYESYLSPVEYTGPQIRGAYERMRQWKTGGGRWHEQWWAQAYASKLTNRSKSGQMYQAMANLNYGVLYGIPLHSRLKLYVGPQLDAHAGAVLNRRNSNNPAQAQIYASLDASAMAVYKFKLWNYPLIARLQGNLPLIGAKFSPEYGESYYEMFVVGNNARHVYFTSPHNALTWRQLLSLDFPVGLLNMRLAYVMDIQQSSINHIRFHSYSHSFMVGLTKNFYLLKGKRAGMYHPQYPAY